MKSFKELHQKYSVGKLIKKIDDRYGFQALVRIMSGHWFNPFATFYVNIFSFPFRQALRFPMFVYGRPAIYHVVGDMRVIGTVKTGMIKLNNTNVLSPPCQSQNSEISNLGSIIFYGTVRIGCGTRMLIQKGALLELGNDVLIGDGVNLGCHHHISIGGGSRIAHRCQIQESNHHFIADMINRTVRPCTRPISIGRNCWICNSTTITGGTVISDCCIVASNSLVNGGKKDIENAPAGSVIGGIPAKLIASKESYRVFNKKLEGKLFLWFEEHKDSVFQLPDNISVDELIDSEQ